MHIEAFAMTAQYLGFPLLCVHKKYLDKGFKSYRKTTICKFSKLQKINELGFHFDNETIKIENPTKPFEIDTYPVSIIEMVKFRQSDVFNNKDLWSMEGWHWKNNIKNNTFLDLCSLNNSDQIEIKKWFGHKHFFMKNSPAIHISFYEAEAYCNWKKSRLPTEFEWLYATQNNLISWGTVWEWTATIFDSYKGFKTHPYKEYSKPWFGNHQVVKGKSFATQEKFKNKLFRNFYQKHRNDVFIGFRTVKDL